jgi:hypothetical protein
MQFREQPIYEDMEAVASILKNSGFFNEEEQEVGVSLVRERLEQGEKSFTSSSSPRGCRCSDIPVSDLSREHDSAMTSTGSPSTRRIKDRVSGGFSYSRPRHKSSAGAAKHLHRDILTVPLLPTRSFYTLTATSWKGS